MPASTATDARVDAFRATCIPDRQDFEAILDRASADGWKVVTGDADPELKAVLDASLDGSAGTGSAIHSFRKDIDSRAIFLVASRVTFGGITSVAAVFLRFCRHDAARAGAFQRLARRSAGGANE